MNTIEQAREVTKTLRMQALEIAALGNAGWGNTMSDAADTIDALIAELEIANALVKARLSNSAVGVQEHVSCGYDETTGSCTQNPCCHTAAGAQPVQQEPVLYQRRMRPEWREREWFPWETCTKECADDFERKPILNNWIYEVRRLYAQPVQSRPMWDYFALHKFAEDNRISYNGLCTAVKASLLAAPLQAGAQPAQKQQPFGYVSEHNCQGPFQFQFHKESTTVYTDNCKSITTVYAAPADHIADAGKKVQEQRKPSPIHQEWLEERAHRRCSRYIMIDTEAPYQFDVHTLMDLARDIEAKIKEQQ